MRMLSVAEFENRELHNGEEYILVCDIGAPLTTTERRQIMSQIYDGQNRFEVVDEWTDDQYRYYVKIRVVENIIWGIAVILALSTVFVFAAGKALSETVSAVGVAAPQVFPIGVILLAALAVVAVWSWPRRKPK